MVTMTADSATVNNVQTSISTSVVDTTPKKPNEIRRSNKPIMEKRRRARINNCLNELKSLILDAMKKDPARHSKLEKADILEMTVKHLESMQRQQHALSAATDPHILNKFKAGFTECAGEVGKFPGLDPAVRRRLLQHLASCLNTNNNDPHQTNPQDQHQQQQRITSVPVTPSSQSGLQVHIVPQQPVETVQPIPSNGNGIFLSAGAQSVQLVPTRLPNGDIALVLPSNSTTNNVRSMAPSPTSSTSSSTSPLPMLVPIPSRTSTNTRTSPIGFERLSVSIPQNESTPNEYSQQYRYASPNSTARYSSSSEDSPNNDYRFRSPSPFQRPLSLVIDKKYEPCMDEERPWRPW